MIELSVLAGIFSLLFLSAIWRGYVLSWLWLWFVVPLGAPSIGIAWAIGLSVLISMLCQTKNINEEQNGEAGKRLAKSFAFMAIYPLITLFIGWLAHSAMVG